jgi:hypothetical protein
MLQQAAAQWARRDAATDAATIAGQTDHWFFRRGGVDNDAALILVDDEILGESYTEPAL